MMKQRKDRYILFFAALAMMLVILDSKTALAGAKEGVSLCIVTVLPSLFPFFFLSNLINSRLLGYRLTPLRPFARLCGVPEGAESILMLGFLGGYPVGAQAIAQAYYAGSISKASAKRMLGFCNNAGPAFIFGMLVGSFSSAVVPWLIWGIHIFSALLTGVILPGKKQERCTLQNQKPASIPKSLEQSIRAVGKVCGWVILFKIILTFLDRWFLWLLPKEMHVLLAGFIELSNGCIQITSIDKDYIRFILCCCTLSFGGLCVSMQTTGVTESLGTGMYYPGKILQTLFSLLLAIIVGRILFTDFYIHSMLLPTVVLILIIFLIFIYQMNKKNIAFQSHRLYNNKKQTNEVMSCCLEKRSSVPAAIALTEQR